MSARLELNVSDDVSLPLALVTQKIAIIAMSGAGKSNAGVVLAEEMFRCEVPWIAIDPKGDWWGMRSNRAGTGPGLRVPVFGGEHGDIPLSAKSGVRMAELVAAGKVHGIFDVSEFDTKNDLMRFLFDFASTLLRLQKTPLHIFCEECDEYFPQGGAGGQMSPLAAQCVGAWKKLAKRGRTKGLGFTMISQRVAAVNKDALYQCDTLFAMRVTGERDYEAVRGWVRQHRGSEELLKSLATLEDGEAWIWSPQKLKLMKRTKFRRRSTYDSGRTPEIGEALPVPKLAAIDLDALRAEMEEPPAESGKHTAHVVDDGRLRARVRELEGELKQAEETRVKLELLTIELLERIGNARDALESPSGKPGSVIVERDAKPEKRRRPLPLSVAPPYVEHALKRSREAVLAKRAPSPATPAPQAPAAPRGSQPSPDPPRPPTGPLPPELGAGQLAILAACCKMPGGCTRPQITALTGYKKTTRDVYLRGLSFGGWVTGVRAETPARSGSDRIVPTAKGRKLGEAQPSSAGIVLGAGERRVLGACAQHAGGCTRGQLTALTGFKKTTRDVYIRKLVTLELAEIVDARIVATEFGRSAGPFEELPKGKALRDHWLEELPEGEGKILAVALKFYPKAVTRDALTELTGYKKTTRDVYLRNLVARELVETTDDGVKASASLFA